MTVAQAIRLLDPATTVEAITEIEYYNGFSGRTAAVQAITDASIIACDIMRKQEASAPKWISVEERLPEGGDKVLVSYLGYVNIAFYRWDNVFELPNTVIIDPHKGNITHWMEMPEPPKGEA